MIATAGQRLAAVSLRPSSPNPPQEYLTSQGVEVNQAEPAPADPYLTSRILVDKPDVTSKTPSDFDKLKQFIALDRRVLRFFCVWDDRDQVFGEKRKFV